MREIDVAVAIPAMDHVTGCGTYTSQGVISANAVVACPLGNDVLPENGFQR